MEGLDKRNCMKMIKIQNCTDYKDNMFNVFVDGEKHVACNFFMKFLKIMDIK